MPRSEQVGPPNTPNGFVIYLLSRREYRGQYFRESLLTKLSLLSIALLGNHSISSSEN